ncbi:MAG: class I adenylate-forming enzyme family protein [Halovenus sp.]
MSTSKELNFDLGGLDTARHVADVHSYTVADLLEKQSRSHPDRTAIVAEDGSEMTYSDLDDRANRLGNALADRGLDRGSRVAILSGNRPEYAEVLFAAAKLGAIVPTINWRQARDELVHCLSIADPDAIVVSGDQQEKVEWIEDSEELDPDVVALDGSFGTVEYESLVDSGDPRPPEPSTPVRREDALLILYTSGTTGLPKGAVISHDTLLYRALAWNVTGDVGPDFVGWGPMYHMISTEPLLTVVLLGGTFYTVDGFKTELVLERHRRADTGYFIFVPGVVDLLLDHADEHGIDTEAYDSLRKIGALADLVDPDKIQRLTQLFDAEYLNTFGSTEVGFPPLSNDTIPVGTRPGSDALSKSEGPLCEVTLVDEDWQEVSTGEYGEMAVRGPTVFSGYVGNTEANHEDFRDGWFRTGDMFVRNEDGTYDFIDRRKYLIKSGGENVYPAELERVLLDHEEITEVVVVRVPDDEWGEVPKAYVSTAPDSDLTPDVVLGYMEGRIARYKLPHYVEFVDQDEFPRSTSGKIVRGDVEEWGASEDQRVRSP